MCMSYKIKCFIIAKKMTRPWNLCVFRLHMTTFFILQFLVVYFSLKKWSVLARVRWWWSYTKKIREKEACVFTSNTITDWYDTYLLTKTSQFGIKDKKEVRKANQMTFTLWVLNVRSSKPSFDLITNKGHKDMFCMISFTSHFP